MNKNELVTAIASKAGLTKVDTAKMVEAFSEVVQQSLKQGDDVRLIGFGTFTVVNRSATVGRNPQTGEKINIKASKQPKFRPGKALKDALN